MSSAAPPEPGVVLRRSRIAGMTIAKAGLIVTGPNCHGKLIGGFSFAKDPGRAEIVAKLEVLERYYALFDVIRPSLLDGRFVRTVAWPCMTPIDPLPVERCVLGAHPFGQGDFLDASGLACHRQLGLGAQHAIHELIERHFLASIWYHGEELIAHPSPPIVGADCEIHLYTLARRPFLPFVLAVITYSDDRFASFGSCFSLEPDAARAHAVNEAAMLLDGYLEGDSGICASSKDRVLSLRDPALSKRRLDHIASLCVANAPLRLHDQANIYAAYDHFIGEIGDISLAILHENDELAVCRAVIPALRRLANSRKTRNDRTPIDPFC